MGTEIERTLAKISDVSLGFVEDVGVFSLTVCFDYDGGTGQCLSGYTLDTYNENTKHREGTAGGLDFIMRVLGAAGVSKLDDLKGKEVWVEHDWSHVYSIESPSYRKNEGKFDVDDWRQRWWPDKSKIRKTT